VLTLLHTNLQNKTTKNKKLGLIWHSSDNTLTYFELHLKIRWHHFWIPFPDTACCTYCCCWGWCTAGVVLLSIWEIGCPGAMGWYGILCMYELYGAWLNGTLPENGGKGGGPDCWDVTTDCKTPTHVHSKGFKVQVGVMQVVTCGICYIFKNDIIILM